MTRREITEPAVVRARLNEGLVLAHGIATGVITTREITAAQDAIVRWALQQAIGNHRALAAAIVMAEIGAAGDPPLIDAHDVWQEAA